MQSQIHISPDNLITLTSEPTLTVNAEYPEGIKDWIIALAPGGWHTHPDSADPNAFTLSFIRNILEDRSVLQVWYKDNQIKEVCVLNAEWETISSEIVRFESNPIPGYSIVYRLWSGQVLSQSSPV